MHSHVNLKVLSQLLVSEHILMDLAAEYFIKYIFKEFEIKLQSDWKWKQSHGGAARLLNAFNKWVSISHYFLRGQWKIFNFWIIVCSLVRTSLYHQPSIEMEWFVLSISFSIVTRGVGIPTNGVPFRDHFVWASIFLCLN